MNRHEYLEHHERQRDRLLAYVLKHSKLAVLFPIRITRDLATDAYWILESDREAGKSVLSSGELKDRLKQIARERFDRLGLRGDLQTWLSGRPSHWARATAKRRRSRDDGRSSKQTHPHVLLRRLRTANRSDEGQDLLRIVQDVVVE